MIELNCTYEESTKIFELGYDFSKVCWKSQYWYNSHGIAEHIHGTGLLLSTIEYRIKSNGCKDAVITGVIPIIPKAALEACLPDINPSNDERLPDLDICRLRVSKYHTDMCDREHEEIIREFSSVFEAFTWCHENYPKELKKKFEEVMK